MTKREFFATPVEFFEDWKEAKLPLDVLEWAVQGNLAGPLKNGFFLKDSWFFWWDIEHLYSELVRGPRSARLDRVFEWLDKRIGVVRVRREDKK